MGGFLTIEEAALAYNLASEKLHGEFGQRNPLPPMSRETVKRVAEKVAETINVSTIEG